MRKSQQNQAGNVMLHFATKSNKSKIKKTENMKKVISIFSISVIIFLSSCKTEVNKKCSLCGGSGTITEKVTCDECKGKGQIKCTYSATYGSNRLWFKMS